jgi:hypothetical protein
VGARAVLMVCVQILDEMLAASLRGEDLRAG